MPRLEVNTTPVERQVAAIAGAGDTDTDGDGLVLRPIAADTLRIAGEGPTGRSTPTATPG